MNDVIQMPTMVNPDCITTLAEARKELDRLQMAIMDMGQEKMELCQKLDDACSVANSQWKTITWLLAAWEENDSGAIMKQLARLHAHIHQAQTTNQSNTQTT